MISGNIWRQLFNSSPDGLFTLTQEGRVVDGNPTFLAWLGLPKQAVVGHLFSRYIGPESSPPFPLPGPVWAGFVRINSPKGSRMLSLTLTGIDNSLFLIGVARMAPDVNPLRETIRRKMDELDTTQLITINAIARLAEYHDRSVGEHLERVRMYTYTLASTIAAEGTDGLQLSESDIVELSRCAVLHDVGKVAVSEKILAKPGPLTPSERSMMQTHCLFGERFLAEADAELQRLLDVPATFLTTARQVALSHHERYDGQGYPNGLKGEAIPLSARIVAVADVYDALTSTRPYKPAWTHARARDYIVSEAGAHFDPRVVAAFGSAEEIMSSVLDMVQPIPQPASGGEPR